MKTIVFIFIGLCIFLVCTQTQAASRSDGGIEEIDNVEYEPAVRHNGQERVRVTCMSLGASGPQDHSACSNYCYSQENRDYMGGRCINGSCHCYK